MSSSLDGAGGLPAGGPLKLSSCIPTGDRDGDPSAGQGVEERRGETPPGTAVTRRPHRTAAIPALPAAPHPGPAARTYLPGGGGGRGRGGRNSPWCRRRWQPRPEGRTHRPVPAAPATASGPAPAAAPGPAPADAAGSTAAPAGTGMGHVVQDTRRRVHQEGTGHWDWVVAPALGTRMRHWAPSARTGC